MVIYVSLRAQFHHEQERKREDGEGEKKKNYKQQNKYQNVCNNVEYHL